MIQLLLLACFLLLLSGCGPTHAIFLTSGAKGIIEKDVQVTASVPDETGKLQPHVTVTLPAGTEFRGK